jgi:CRP/FNR family transcriptional regulator
MSEVEDIHSCKLERHLANFLILGASSDGTVRITQQEMASHLGTTREVVARALGQLASTKRIRTGREQIVIDDPAALAADINDVAVQRERSASMRCARLEIG